MSKSALLLSPCIAWAGPLAQWYEEDRVDKEDLTKRNQGTDFHRAIDILHKGNSVQIDDHEVSAWVGHAEKYLHGVLEPRCDSLQSEVAVSVNWSTGEAEILPKVTDRQYPNRPGWQNGTADLVGILKNGGLLVADWKTGTTDGAEEQLLSLGYGFQQCMTKSVACDQGQHGFEVTRPVTTLCLYVNSDGVWPKEVQRTNVELQAHADAMRFQWEDIQNGSGRLSKHSPGVHCTALYCPHLGYCKAISTAMEAMAMEGNTAEPLIPVGALTRFRVTDKPLSDEEAGFTQAMVSAANRQIKYLTAANKKRVESGGKVTSGAYVWDNKGNGYRWHKN